jgi:hypothetical protein
MYGNSGGLLFALMGATVNEIGGTSESDVRVPTLSAPRTAFGATPEAPLLH